LEYVTGDDREEAKQRQALTIPAIFSSSMSIAKMAAAHVPEIVTQAGHDDEAVPVKGHEFENVLHDPNPWMSSTFLFWFTYLCLPVRGNAFWFLADDLQGGPIQQLWPIPPWKVTPVPGTSTDDFISHYNYRTEREAKPIQIPARNVLWMRVPNIFDLFDGMSLITPLAMNVDTADHQRSYRSNFFGEQHARPAVSIGIRKEMSQPQFEIIKEEILREMHVLNRATLIHRAGDVDVNMMGMSADDLGILQFDAADAATFKEVLGWSEALGAKDTTYASMYAAEDLVVSHTVWPYMQLIAGDISAQIIKPRYGDPYRCRYKDIREGRADVDRADYMTYGQDRTINENREVKGQDPITTGPAAEICQNVPIRLLSNLQAMGVGKPEPPPEAPQREKPTQSAIAPSGNGRMEVRGFAGDLDRWERKALRFLQEGRGGGAPFESELIPADMSIAIGNLLSICSTPAQIKSVFAEARTGAVSPYIANDGWLIVTDIESKTTATLDGWPIGTPVEWVQDGGSVYAFLDDNDVPEMPVPGGKAKGAKLTEGLKAPTEEVLNLPNRDRRFSIDGDADSLGDVKDQLEIEFEQELLRFWRRQLERIDIALGAKAPSKFQDPIQSLSEKTTKAIDWTDLPKWIQNALNARFWSEEDKELIAVLLGYLERGANAAVNDHFLRLQDAAIGVGVDWSLVNTEVAEWASAHAGELCRATYFNSDKNRYEFTSDKSTINANTRRAIGVRVSTWFETPGATLGNLMEEIGQLRAFGPQAPEVPGKQTRAQLVATTEITRSVAHGNKIAADQLTEQLSPLGVVATDRWNTNRDDKVCVICRPLQGKKVPHGNPFGKHPSTGQDIYIPVDDTHPGCYCWISTRYTVLEEHGRNAKQ
jgi:hypothetical protein